MIHTPLISVIMSVYNGEKYIHTAIESILNQTVKEFEFIIIDDASTDNTPVILDEFKKADSRIKIIKKEKNNGLAGFIKNLNIGLETAKGKYIARMDADDISEPYRFEKQIEFLETNTEIFIVGSSIQCIDKNGAHLQLIKSSSTDVAIKENMIKKIQLFHPVIMFRNNTDFRYLEKMLYCEDYDLYFRLMTEGYKFANIQEPLLKYRLLEDSISRKDNKLIKWIFVEKARQFYLQRKSSGKDSYNNLIPENLLSVLEPDYENESEDILFSAKTAMKYNCDKELQQLITKGKSYFPSEYRFKIYSIFLLLPKFFTQHISKVFR